VNIPQNVGPNEKLHQINTSGFFFFFFFGKFFNKEIGKFWELGKFWEFSSFLVQI
jgi:hypothetical protein